MISKAFVFILLFCVFTANAQHPLYQQLSEKDGLPDIEFYDIVEDKDGFIWLAADKGLFRYDGETFKNYTHPEKRGLSVFGLKFDHKGRLWCNNIYGQYFYIENDSLQLFTSLKKYSRGQLGQFLFFDHKLNVTCFQYNLEIDLETKEIKRILPETKSHISAFKKGDTLFYVNDYHFKYKTITNDSIKTLSSLVLTRMSTNNLFKINNDLLLQSMDYSIPELNLFLSTNNKSFTKLTSEQLDLKFPVVNIFLEDGYIWLCGTNAVYKYKYVGGEFILVETLFENKKITKIFKDKNGNYWLTSLQNGIYIIPNIHIKKYALPEDDEHISALVKIDANTLLYGTKKGTLIRKNISTNQERNIVLPNRTQINKLAFNGSDKLIVSIGDKGYILNTSDDSSYNSKFLVGLGNAKGLSFINEHEFVIGGFAFAEILDLTRNTNKRIGFRRAYNTHYNTATEKIYVSFVDGLEWYGKDLIPHEITFNGQPIFAIDIDNTSNNIVWVSTFSNGILGVKNGKTIYNYTVEDGLLSNRTRAIKADGNYLWIVTDKGIQRFNTEEKTFKNLTKRDGLTSFNISEILIFDDQLVFGSNKGLYQLDKNKVFKPVILQDFYFTKIQIEDKEVPIKDQYDLPHDSNKIKFEFQTNGYLSEESMSYYYRLLGSNDTWSAVTQGVNEVVFNSLSSGNYTFQLKGVEINGSKETTIREVAIKINLPFYKTWGFIGIISLLFISVIGFGFLQRENSIKKRQKQLLEKERLERQMVSSKLKSLQSQLNPHFVFNAMNSIQNLILKDDKKDAYAYLTKFASLMRENLNMSEKSFVYFDEEVSHLKKYLELEKLRFRNNFTYTLAGQEDIEDIKIPSTIIQPFIENGIKHGLLHKKEGKRNIEITFSQEGEVLKCVIVDNGIGIEAAKAIEKSNELKSESFSTKAIKEKLNLLKKYYDTDIGFHYEDVTIGTKVILKIPAKLS